jgi:hypothetical protein
MNLTLLLEMEGELWIFVAIMSKVKCFLWFDAFAEPFRKVMISYSIVSGAVTYHLN